MSLTLLPLGTGDAFSAERHSCCNALVYDDDGTRAVLLIDCPHPLRKVMRDAARVHGLALDVADVTACALTHLHADHASGVEGFLWYSRFVLGDKGTLALHDDVRARLWDGHLAGGMEQLLGEDGAITRLSLDDLAACVRLSEEAPAPIGPFSVEVRRTRHHIPTFALRVRAGEASVAFSADTAFDPALIAWLLEADLAVHEAGHGHAHTPLEALAALPAAARDRMRLTHLGDDVDRTSLPIAALEEGRPIGVR
ncbi:MAG: MBL fold hydrolase [Deltaproteobacteria bacterium RBG_16_71_12]|nr:MAG: MBL fold hydrolase [Deltaproteobacteria bacterium RBG_16_71_12]